MALLQHKVCIIFLVFLLFTCKEKSVETKPLSKNVSYTTIQNYKLLSPEDSNIYFTNKIKETQNFNYLLYPFIYFGGGVSIGDINNDGLPDVYFTGNMGHNKLYLNQGDLKFLDITKSAGVEGVYNHWTTGITMADVNNDGYLDLYVSVAGPGNVRKNLLYINQKNNTFKEEAIKYGIACNGHSMQSTFFDYDNDGDLDLYVGNYPPSGFNKKSDFFVSKMKNPKIKESDRLYRNDKGRFVDVTKTSGILNYGLTLGLSVADFNNDGWSDIYVSNDFNSIDYLYINQKDGTFLNEVLSYTKHTSNFGMGIDSGDINNDGFIDFIQLDMMGNTNEKQKANMSAMNSKLFYDMVDKGLHHQYMKNVLQLNTGLNSFMDIGEFAGIANTDWSWGTLLMDMNNSGHKDIFITNGMLRNVNDNDFNAAFRIQKSYGKIEPSQYINWVYKMPSEPVENFVFHNMGDLNFKKKNSDYGVSYKGFSNGAAYADLDLDGDLDLVVNNLNEVAHIYENHLSSQKEGNYIRIKLSGVQDNNFGIGAKVNLYVNGEKHCEELNLTRGYESSVEPIIHFGLGEIKAIDSLEINWPKGETEMLYNVVVNRLTEIIQGKNKLIKRTESEQEKLFKVYNPSLSPAYTHKENKFDDFEREVLLPHKMSQFGPAMVTGDVNSDGLDDFYIGGASGFSGALYLQKKDGSFSSVLDALWEKDKNHEDVSATFFDANNDGFLDLYVVSGGNEKPYGDDGYQDRLYVNNGKGSFYKSTESLPEFFVSGSCVKVLDFDNDGDNDLFIGGRQVPGKYPFPTNSCLLRNDSNSKTITFTDVSYTLAPDLIEIGMVTDATCTDINNDGWEDIIIVGEWMSFVVLENDKGVFKRDRADAYGFGNNVGWWNCIESYDLDKDGDMDLIAGNIGLNYKYKASKEEPFKVFSDDFDKNGETDIVLGYYCEGELFPLRGRACSSQQIPSIKKKFPNYKTFSQANLIDVYTKDKLNSSLQYEAVTFANTIFMNEGGKFTPKALPNFAQMSSVNAIYVEDLTNDGNTDIFVAGNMYGSEVETPRNDASQGLFLRGNGNGSFLPYMPNKSGFKIEGEIKRIMKLKLSDGTIGFLVARNNENLVIIKREY